MPLQTDEVRKLFPILQRRVRTLDGRERPLVYLDHGASTHAPKPVIDAVTDTLTWSYANIHRGNHTLSIEASDRFDEATASFLKFVHAEPDSNCALLGQNTTMALDMAAHMMAGRKGKTLTTLSEHHSNDLPHRRRGDVLHADVDDQGRILIDDVQAKLDQGDIKLLAVTGASNVTGHTPPIHKLARMAHGAGARILVDAAQLYAHAPIDVRPDGSPEHIDFLAAAGHKAYAPLGSAFLIGPRDVLDAAPPYMPGGGTVDWVTDSSALFTKAPDRHMGGTPNIVGAIAFGAATEWLASVGMENVQRHERDVTAHALKRFAELGTEHGIELFGPRTASEKVGVFSFTVPQRRHELVSSILDHEFGIATRNGCFCAHPLLHRLLKLGDTSPWTDALNRGETLPLPGAVRATVGIYNTEAEVDLLADALAVIAKGTFKGQYETADHKLCSPIGVDAAAVVQAGR